jgi:CheY-like chemotaxis protein
MPGGGKLRIQTINVALDEEFCRQHPDVSPGEYVTLAVTDTGTGMDEDVQQHVFEPFFTTKSEGSGLGLATCYAIAKQCGGAIEVQSKKGAGTTFRVYFPRSSEAVTTAPEPEAARELPRGDETILLAEDEPSVRSLADHVLRELGYSTLVATDGDEALSLVRRHPAPIDLLLTDVVMPNLGGRELAARLREHNPGTRVLFITGYAEAALEEDAAREPGIGFLQKPFTPTMLAERVRKLLDGTVSGPNP